MTAYLDHNATTPVRPAARAAALEVIEETGNASSVHAAGRRARARLERAREQVATVIGCTPRAVVFTSGGTEANHIVLHGCGRKHLLVSAVEHPSVLQCHDEVTVVQVDAQGRVDLAALKELLAQSKGDAMVSVMAANNETGVVQPLEAVIDLAHAHGALVHSDAVQAATKFDGAWKRADFLTISAHKLGGLQGAGAVVTQNGAVLRPVRRGGGQELGLRSGTEALPALSAFGAAADEASNDDGESLRGLRDTLETAMMEVAPDAVVLGDDAERLPQTLAIAHPSVDAETLVMRFDLEGVAISAGSACSSGKMAASHVVEAMGRPDLARHVIRLSLGWSTTADDCEQAVAAWSRIVGSLPAASHAA